MPIVPRIESVESNITVPDYPVQPVHNALPEVFKAVSAAAHEAEGAFASMYHRKQLAEDTAEISKRLMAGQNFIDATTDAIKRDPELRKNAPEEYDKIMNKYLADTVSKDLREDVAAQLVRRLTPRVITGRRAMRATQDEYKIADWKATAQNVEDTLIDRAGRLDLSDSDVFAAVQPRKADLYVTQEPASVSTRSDYGASVDAAVNATLLKPDEGRKREADTLDKMAYRRIQRMVISENPADVQRAIDLLKEEESGKGTNFTQYLSAEKDHHNILLKAALGQKDMLEQRAIRDANAAATLAENQRKEREREDKERDSTELGQLSYGILTGKMGMSDFNQLVLSNPTLLKSHELQEHYINLINTVGREGGTTNWDLYNRYYNQIVQSRGAAQINDSLLSVTNKVGGIARKDAEKLMTFSTQQAERSVFKDDFFQEGQKDIARAFQAGVGIMDDQKAARYAAASREFYDLARPLVEAGQREKIPDLARQVSDRWLTAAGRVNVGVPSQMTRFKSQEDLVTDYVNRLGPDPSKWSAHEFAEFGRQAKILAGQVQGLIEKSAEAPSKKGPAQPKPKQPNVIPQ